MLMRSYGSRHGQLVLSNRVGLEFISSFSKLRFILMFYLLVSVIAMLENCKLVYYFETYSNKQTYSLLSLGVFVSVIKSMSYEDSCYLQLTSHLQFNIFTLTTFI